MSDTVERPRSPNLFQKGSSGRPPGIPNHQGLVKARLKELGFDWVLEAVTRYRDEKTPSASKDYCLGLITDRVAPKLKAVEITGATTDQTRVLINILSGETPIPTIQSTPVFEDIKPIGQAVTLAAEAPISTPEPAPLERHSTDYNRK